MFSAIHIATKLNLFTAISKVPRSLFSFDFFFCTQSILDLADSTDQKSNKHSGVTSALLVKVLVIYRDQFGCI